jgi:cytochrome c oxidase subunit III
MRTPPLAEQFEDLRKQTHAAHLGMWIFLGSEVLLFAGFFALYGAYRAMYPVDFAAAITRNDVAIGTVNTFILITSSLTVVFAVHEARRGNLRRTSRFLVASIAFGAAFLFLKGMEYGEHFHEGIFPGAGYRYAELPGYGARMFFTLYYLMTGLHAIHVIGGMALLGWLILGCRNGRYSAVYHTPVELGGLYWHLIDVIWIFLWPLLYLTHR